MQLIKKFEKAYPRNDLLPCASVEAYGADKLARVEKDISDDELDLELGPSVDQHFAGLA